MSTIEGFHCTTISSLCHFDSLPSYHQVVEYNRKAHERDPMKLDWVDTELKADIQRIHVKLETSFLENVLVSLPLIESRNSV